MADLQENDNLVLLGGKSATGKSLSLMFMKNPEKVMYLNCENNKKLPFRSKFLEKNVTDPLQIYQAFDVAETMPDINTIVVDTATYMMDMYETLHVINSANTMKAWGEYAQFWKRLLSQYVARSTKNVIFLAHTSDIVSEDMVAETVVKFKGSIMNTGVEAAFSTVISSKKMALTKLAAYKNPLLNITEEEEMLGFKYVYQTRLTKETVNERIRSSIGMWTQQETFIDNNIQHVIDRLHEYYK